MSDCHELEPALTAYVDGDPSDRAAVEGHLAACAGCRARVDAERAVCALVRDRRGALTADLAPAGLRARIAAAAAGPAVAATPRPGPRPAWHLRAIPLALAATLILILGGLFLYQATGRSARILAAELTADHLKCFAANRVMGLRGESGASVQAYLASSFGWDVRLPALAGLTLEAARPCLYGEGRAAHVMYRYGGRPVSLFMLPGTTRPAELVEVMGHEAAIWSGGGRTFVLIARESPHQLEQLAAAMHDLR